MRELHLNMEECGRLPLPRVWEILKHFKTAPPVHLLVRDYLGYETKDENTPAPMPGELAAAPINTNLPEAVRQHLAEMRKQRF